MVEVIEGSLANLQGKVLSVTGDTALIMPKHEDLTVSGYCITCTRIFKQTKSICECSILYLFPAAAPLTLPSHFLPLFLITCFYYVLYMYY